jgi:spermidine synthase
LRGITILEAAGRHLLVEYYKCNLAVLNETQAIESLLKEAALAAGATVVNSVFHNFSPQGVSGIVVIEESHLSIHTWPEHGYAAVDFFTCGDCTPDRAHEVIREGLGAKHFEKMLINRGVLGQGHSMIVTEHSISKTGETPPPKFWYDEEFKDICRFGLKAREYLFQSRSEFQKIDILDTEFFGRVLAIDNIFMTSEFDEYLYHEMLVHPALTTAPCIERILVIGGGDGGTVREVLTYPQVKEVTMVEIDPLVVEASKKFLGNIGSAWDDPRLEVKFQDGIDYAINEDVEPYDIILLDGCDPVGPAKGLFTQAFYRGCKRLLKEDGVFALQSESPLLQREVFIEIGRTLAPIFRRVYPYFGTVPLYATGNWSWTYATETINPMAIGKKRVTLQEKRCKYYNRDIHRGAFAIPNNLRHIFADGKVAI